MAKRSHKEISLEDKIVLIRASEAKPKPTQQQLSTHAPELLHLFDDETSLIRQPLNPTLFSFPVECWIKEVSLYYLIASVNLYTGLCLKYIIYNRQIYMEM